MPEEFEEQSKPIDVDRVLDLVQRRHLHFLAPLLLGWLLVWGVSWIIPARYKSSTVILVQEPSVPKDYVVSNINDNVAMRLESLTEQMMSRTRLAFIIHRLHLYEGSKGPATENEQVEKMRKDISVDMVRNPDQTISSFRVSYTAYSPRVAQQVTSELSNLFIHYNQQQIQTESENTTAFMTKQLEDARKTLAQQEARVREFESAHQGELPSQQQSNIQILNGLQSQLQNEQDALNSAQQQRVYFQSLIEQYRTQAPPEPKVAGIPTDSLGALDAQIAKMKADLSELHTRYTDRHPAVQSLKEALAQTQKQRNQLAAELGVSGTSRPVDTQQQTALLQLQSQLQANQTEISNRQREIEKLKARIDEYQQRLNAEPAAQQQLADLTRGYEQSQTNYNELLKKQNDSAMATDLEQMQQGERFSVLDPPSLPTRPDFPNRLKFCFIGLAVGIGLGAAVVALLEYLDDRLHRDEDIENLLPTAVISEIPEILRGDEERRRNARAMLGWAAGAFVFLVILAGSAFSYLHA